MLFQKKIIYNCTVDTCHYAQILKRMKEGLNINYNYVLPNKLLCDLHRFHIYASSNLRN